MKTTLDVPENLYRQIKAQAALKGQSITGFLIDALREKLSADTPKPTEETGWKAAFGTAKSEEVAKVQKVIDDEFSSIDPEDWQ